MEERILGIDPGLNTTGYAVLEVAGGKPLIREAGIITSRPRGTLAERLREIHVGVVEVIRALEPACMAIEELYTHYERPTTAILMGHARGVICLAAGEAGLPLTAYAATQVKKILTGNGRASKTQVQGAITHELRLEKVPDPPDVADALAIALCHFHLGKRTLK